GFDFALIFFANVAQIGPFLVTERGVRIEAHLGVAADELTVFRDDERVDLQEAHVALGEGFVELLDQIIALRGEIAADAEGSGDLGGVRGGDAGQRIDADSGDLFRRVVGDFFDVHAAGFRRDKGDAALIAIDERGEIELLCDLDAFFDVDAFDDAASIACLQRDQRVAEHLRGEETDIFRLEGDADAALLTRGSFLELALAAAASVDLALHRPDRTAELGGGVDRFFGGEGREAARNRGAEALEDGFALVFVDVHGGPSGSRIRVAL